MSLSFSLPLRPKSSCTQYFEVHSSVDAVTIAPEKEELSEHLLPSVICEPGGLPQSEILARESCVYVS